MKIKTFTLPRGQMELFTSDFNNEITINKDLSCRSDKLVKLLTSTENIPLEVYFLNFSNTSDLRISSGKTMRIPTDKFITDFGDI